MVHETTSGRSQSLFEPNQPHTATPPALISRDLSKEMSLFDLDESLCLLIDSALEANRESIIRPLAAEGKLSAELLHGGMLE